MRCGRDGDLSTTRLLTLNIGGPSAERADRLGCYLLDLGLDVIVLTETRSNAGTAALIDRLRAEGFTATWPVPPTAGERGVAVLRRRGLPPDGASPAVDLSHRLVVESVSLTSPLTVLAAYVPSRDASPAKVERKQRFLDQMLRELDDATYLRRTVVMGDFNIVGRHHVPKYSAFRAWEYDALDRIAALGFVDVFATLHPGVQAHSWIGRTGSGYRYDYAFVSPDLVRSVVSCEYLHEPREVRLSDHAGVLLAITEGSEAQADDRVLVEARAVHAPAAARAS